MRSWLPLVLLSACGPRFEPVDMTFTVSNQSGYDFLYTVVCFYEEAGDTCLERDDGLPAGAAISVSAEDVWLERGSVIEIEGAAIDVDGDGYLTPVRTYEVDGPYLDITVAFSIDHCCYEF
jgi:hypothetical protein